MHHVLKYSLSGVGLREVAFVSDEREEIKIILRNHVYIKIVVGKR